MIFRGGDALRHFFSRNLCVMKKILYICSQIVGLATLNNHYPRFGKVTPTSRVTADDGRGG